MTIAEFCDRHDARPNLRAWALANCLDLPHAWETIQPKWLLWLATCPGVLDDRTLRRFAVWCARQVQHLMKDPRSIALLDVAERYAEGQATNEELQAARHAAWAAWSPSMAAARAAWSAAQAAAQAAEWVEWSAAETAAQAAEAAAQAAWSAAGDAAWEAARAAQAAWLRANATPNWEATP